MLTLLRDRPLESLVCPGPDCPSNLGERRKGLSVRYWRVGGTVRYLHCHDCGLEFSERQGTPLFNLRISEQKAFEILNHITEGCGVRGTSRLCGVQEETVIRLQRRCGEHFKRWHDSRVRDVQVHEAQLDEKWSFVKKNRKTAIQRSRRTRTSGTNGIT